MSLGGGHVGHICETVFSFFLEATELCWAIGIFSGQPLFFWTSSRVLQQGYTPGYGGREKGDEGVRGMGGGCQCKKDCKIEVAYSAWQNANVKPVVAKMAFIFVAPTRHVQQSAVVIQLVSNGLPMVDVSEFNSQAWLGSCSNLATMQKEPWAMAKRPSVAKMACVGCCLCVACKAGQNGL